MSPHYLILRINFLEPFLSQTPVIKATWDQIWNNRPREGVRWRTLRREKGAIKGDQRGGFPNQILPPPQNVPNGSPDVIDVLIKILLDSSKQSWKINLCFAQRAASSLSINMKVVKLFALNKFSHFVYFFSSISPNYRVLTSFECLEMQNIDNWIREV